MPLRKRPWPSTVNLGHENTSTEPHPEPAEKRARTTDGATDQHEDTGHAKEDRPQIALHKCPTCYTYVLSFNGLQTHQQAAHAATDIDPPPAKRGRPIGADTIAHRLRATTTEIPVPIQELECPLCFEHLGRKAVASHLRNVHQIGKPSSFPFRPSLDMFPGLLSCMHCKASFTVVFALKNHFDRGTCPVLLKNWVRDAHYGPKVDSVPSQSLQHDQTPLPTQGIHQTWTCGLLLGTDRHSTMALRHYVHEQVDRCIQFRPESRLLWYTFVMQWTIHFPDLPQVALNMGTAPFIVRWIVEPLPLHWAWNSDSPDSWWDPRTIDLDTDPYEQVSWCCIAILELEHALARDFVLSAAFEHGRQYADGRHVICRPSAHMSGTSQAPSNRGGIIAGQSSWERQIEIPIRLLNHLFEARKGLRTPDDVGQADITPRGYAQSDGLGPQLPIVSTGWQRFDPPGNDPGSQGMASSETKHWSHMFSPTGQFPQSGRDPDPKTDEIEVRQPGRSPGAGSQTEGHPDLRECLELPVLGNSGQIPSIHKTTTTAAREDSGDYNPALPAGKSGRPDPMLLRSQAHEQRSDPRRLSGDDPVAPRFQPPQRRVDTAVRDPQPFQRTRDLSVDPASIEANRLAKIPACYRNRPPYSALMHQLLRIKLHNTSNACYINAALLGQLWATLAYEGFDPERWGQ